MSRDASTEHTLSWPVSRWFRKQNMTSFALYMDSAAQLRTLRSFNFSGHAMWKARNYCLELSHRVQALRDNTQGVIATEVRGEACETSAPRFC